MSSLVVQKLVKHYGLTLAVSAVSFSVTSNEIVALVGGNGSGKSTLLKMIAGAIVADSGVVSWDGTTLRNGDSGHARSHGIEMVFQDCALCPDVSVVDNLFLGREPSNYFGFLKRDQMYAEAQQLIDYYRLPIPSLDAACRHMSGGQQKAVAIGRALLSKPKLLILDEPTAALGVKEQQRMVATLKELHALGVGIIICSHSPEEILAIAERGLVLRRGELVHDVMLNQISQNELAILMST